MDKNEAINKFAELYLICKGTQEYFWKSAREHFDGDDRVTQLINQVTSVNKEYAKQQMYQSINAKIEEISTKTSVVLMGILTTAIASKDMSGPRKLKYFDSKVQELTEDYLVSPVLMSAIEKGEKSETPHE